MPIYEYKCSAHGIFETIRSINSEQVCLCPQCGRESNRVPSPIGFVRVHHTEKLAHNDSLRVYDRQRMLKDTAVKKALGEYKEEAHEKAKAINRWGAENA